MSVILISNYIRNPDVTLTESYETENIRIADYIKDKAIIEALAFKIQDGFKPKVGYELLLGYKNCWGNKFRCFVKITEELLNSAHNHKLQESLTYANKKDITITCKRSQLNAEKQRG